MCPDTLCAKQTVLKATVSPSERYDLIHMKLEVCCICTKAQLFYNIAQYGLVYDKSLSTEFSIYIYLLNNLNFGPKT